MRDLKSLGYADSGTIDRAAEITEANATDPLKRLVHFEQAGHYHMSIYMDIMERRFFPAYAS